MNRTLGHVCAALAAAAVRSRPVSRVAFCTNAYQFSHGKRPGGFGSWAFEPKGASTDLPMLLTLVEHLNAQPGLVGRALVDRSPTPGCPWILWMPAGTYGEAKAAAGRLLAAVGSGLYEVCT